MAVLKREDFLNAINARLGDDNSDEALSFITDMTDTFDSLNSGEDWHKKYDENDAMWRKKYRDRFFEGAEPTPRNPKGEFEEPPKRRTFEDLFKKGE